MKPWGKDGTLVAAGASLEYACFGPPPEQAPTIVMLHEGLGCLALWRDFPERLAKATGFGVVAYSRAGYGQSDPVPLPRPLDYMSREASQSLPDVLNAIGFRRGVLLGHSDGATIAALYAGGVSDHRVRGLVLVAPHFFTEPEGLAEIAKAKAAYDDGDLAGRLAKYHRDPDIAFRGWNDCWLDPGFRDWNVADAIDHIRVPILAMQGNDDAYGTGAQLDEIEARAYAPVERVDLAECGHSAFRDQPEAILRAITAYTSRLERIEAAPSGAGR